MEVTKNIYIDNSRNLQLEVTIGQEGQVETMQIDIYNHKSFIDGNPIFQIKNIEGNHYADTITESNINAMDQVLNNSCYAVDLHHSLIVVVVTAQYSVEYLAQQSCCDSGLFTFATYYPCTVYSNIIPSIGELEQECAVPKNFIDGLLKKKAIDLCIESGHYEQACKYWCKFYTRGISTMGSHSSSSRGGCGCHG